MSPGLNCPGLQCPGLKWWDYFGWTTVYRSPKTRQIMDYEHLKTAKMAVFARFLLKAYFFMKPDKKNLKSTLAGKLNLNWPYSPALPQRPKFKFNFPAKETKEFLAGFIEK